MQIDPTRLNQISAPGIQKPTETPATPEATGTQGAGAPEAANGLVLSQQATEVRAAHEALAALPDSRTELVTRLKGEIESGTYQVNAENLAEKMIP